MKSLIFAYVVLCSFAIEAAPMVRVIGARNAAVLTVDRNGVAADVTLAQVIIPPAEATAACEYLRRILAGAWVLIETDSDGRAYVYRSPDGLYVNGELARRAWAAGGVRMTYLGESDPAPQRAESQKPSPPRTRSPKAPARPQRARSRTRKYKVPNPR